MLKNDYNSRLCNEAVSTFMKLVFNVDEGQYENSLADSDVHYQKYRMLIEEAAKGHINDAENRMFNDLNLEDMKDLQSALLFYDYLNNMSEKLLEAGDFSYEEILTGIKEVIKIYGYEGLSEVFHI